MPPYFNTSNLSNASDYGNLITYLDESTGYYFSPLIVMAVWFICFLTFGRYGKEEGFAASSTITFVVGVLFWAVTGSWLPVAVALAALIASGLLLFLRR